MMGETRMRALAGVTTLLILAVGCGSSHRSSNGPTPAKSPATTVVPILHASAPPQSVPITTPGNGMYLLKLTPLTAPGPCAVPGVGSGKDLPFRVSITNTGTVPEPLARIGLTVTDPHQTTSREVVAISYKGLCLNFTEPGGTLSPGQVVTYQGTASGVTPTSKLVANIISTPANQTLASVSLALSG
ncbi:MAG: hypothetical protein ACYC1D_02285 [Acidimicrobiales bacterium]